jgi:hypothetical protein
MVAKALLDINTPSSCYKAVYLVWPPMSGMENRGQPVNDLRRKRNNGLFNHSIKSGLDVLAEGMRIKAEAVNPGKGGRFIYGEETEAMGAFFQA